MSLTSLHFMPPAVQNYQTPTWQVQNCSHELVSNHTSTDIAYQHAPHSIPFVIGKGLRSLFEFFHSKIPSFSLPVAKASDCTTHEAADYCEIPEGTYLKSCPRPVITYNPVEYKCKVSVFCEKHYRDVEPKQNEYTYDPADVPVLENQNGSLSPVFTSEQLTKKLTMYYTALKHLEFTLADRSIEDDEREQLQTSFDAVKLMQDESIIQLNKGTILSLDTHLRPQVVDPSEFITSQSTKELSGNCYDTKVVTSFQKLANATGAIVGLSPNLYTFPTVTEIIFRHIIGSTVPGQALNIVIMIDKTGSLGNQISQIKDSIRLTLTRMKSDKPMHFLINPLVYETRSCDFLDQASEYFSSDFSLLKKEYESTKFASSAEFSSSAEFADKVEVLQIAKEKILSGNNRNIVIFIGDAPVHRKALDTVKSCGISIYSIIPNFVVH